MATAQTTIGLIYDYDQTLSPNYMQDEVLFPRFGINPTQFWKKSRELVDTEGYDGELAYLKALLDYLALDRPTNAELSALGANLKFYPASPPSSPSLALPSPISIACSVSRSSTTSSPQA
jgi:hypothetical protein